MNFNHYKLVVILLLGVLLTVYTNCGQPFGGPSELVFNSNVYGGSPEASYGAFEQTVYPITRSYCVSCHSSLQPKHASDDVKEAHDAVISQFKVNFANIPASRLVAKLRDDKHNCWGDCSENAAEMQAAIEEWNGMIKSSGIDHTPVQTALVTEETAPLGIEFSDPSNPLKSNSVKLNIDAATLIPPMVLTRLAGTDGHISVPNTNMATLGNTAANAGMANFYFSVPESGDYRFWGLVQGENNADNAFYVKIYDGNTQVGGTRTWDFPSGSQFEWRQVPGNNFNLSTNKTYRLELRQREDGARLSGFIVTGDMTFNGQEVDDYFGITLSFDLSNLLNTSGVSLLIDVIDYDAYSYKVSKPRIVSTSSNVYVKGLKLLVNDVFSPQHSTYTVVDKIISPEDGLLSDYSMIVLKDRGLSGDHFKFAFDQLALTGSGSNQTTGGSTGGATGSQTSLMAFQSTVYPISRSSAYSCVGCHTSVSPRHSSDNTLAAHDAALSVVDFNNPSNSRIVRKMRDERHNCQAYCDSIANEYQNAIIEWRTRRQ